MKILMLMVLVSFSFGCASLGVVEEAGKKLVVETFDLCEEEGVKK